MNDVLKDFGSSGSVPPVNSYAHPLTDTILKECGALLSEIPEGKRLLALAKEKNYKIEVISGREPDFRYGSEDTSFLICPLNTKAVDLDIMALIYGLCIYELEQPSLGFHRPAPGVPGVDLPQILFRQLLDITLEMCKIVGEFEDTKRSTKLVDYLAKLGHSELYREFRLGKSKEELTKVYSVSINAV